MTDENTTESKMQEHKKINGLSFDDVLLPPVYSTIRSRNEVDTSTMVGPLKLKIPFISSPMDTVTESEMAIEIGRLGGLGVIHRFMSKEEQLEHCIRVKNAGQYVVPAIGVGDVEFERLEYIISNCQIDMVSIDVANGYSILMKEMVEKVKVAYPNLPIMAGNIATFAGYAFMAKIGVDAVRAGIGSGSICKTRTMTGVGVPLLSSVIDCDAAKKKIKSYFAQMGMNVKLPSIIADGGIKYPSDVVKSIVGGADAVMCGGIFAGTAQSPSKLEIINGEQVKMHRGMASASVQKDKRGGLKKGTCSEGVTTHIPYVGTMEDVLFGDDGFVGGLKSGMTYLDCRTISELQDKKDYIAVSPAGLAESHAYGTRQR